MGVSVQGESGAVMAQHAGEDYEVLVVLHGKDCEAVAEIAVRICQLAKIIFFADLYHSRIV